MPPEDSLYLFSAPFYYGFTNSRLQVRIDYFLSRHKLCCYDVKTVNQRCSDVVTNHNDNWIYHEMSFCRITNFKKFLTTYRRFLS